MTENQPRTDHLGTVLIVLGLVLGMIGIALHLHPVALLDLVALIPAGLLLLAGLQRTAVRDAARLVDARWAPGAIGVEGGRTRLVRSSA